MRDVKILFGLSAGLCAFDSCCRRPCIAPATAHDAEAVTGKIAHIEGHSNVGPRANPTLTAKQRDSYENWILLCGDHHDIIDKQQTTHTVMVIRTWKREHEEWVIETYRGALPAVSFAELKIAAHAILHDPNLPSETFTLTSPAAKMQKNGLTENSSFMLTLAIGKARDVEAFVEAMANLDYDYPERLRAGFVGQYNALVKQGLAGDGLFQGLVDFATGISTDFALKAAGLAVLGYLFEKCEVFEP